MKGTTPIKESAIYSSVDAYDRYVGRRAREAQADPVRHYCSVSRWSLMMNWGSEPPSNFAAAQGRERVEEQKVSRKDSRFLASPTGRVLHQDAFITSTRDISAWFQLC